MSFVENDAFTICHLFDIGKLGEKNKEREIECESNICLNEMQIKCKFHCVVSKDEKSTANIESVCPSNHIKI